MKEYTTKSPEETTLLGSEIAACLQGGETIAFRGPMGAGKTTLTHSIVSALGAGHASSPTFSLMHEYKGGRLTVRHFDMYRIHEWEELYSTGFMDYLDDENAVIFIEWSENVEEALPPETRIIEIEFGKNENERHFKLYHKEEKILC